MICRSRNLNKEKELLEPSLLPKDSIQKLEKVNTNIAKQNSANPTSNHSRNLNREKELLKASLLSTHRWIEKLDFNATFGDTAYCLKNIEITLADLREEYYTKKTNHIWAV